MSRTYPGRRMPARTTSTPGVAARARSVRCASVPAAGAAPAKAEVIQACSSATRVLSHAASRPSSASASAGEVREPHEAASRERVEGAVHEDPEPRGSGHVEDASSVHRVDRLARPRLDRVEGELDGGEPRPRVREEALERDGIGPLVRDDERVRGDAVGADAAGGDLRLEVPEGARRPVVENGAGLVPGNAPVEGVGQEVLRIVEEEDVDARQGQPGERRRELVREEVGGDRVPEVRPVFDDLGPGPPRPRAPPRLVEVAALQVARLRDDDDVLAREASVGDRRGEDLPDERLAVAVGVVRRRVDQVDAQVERVGEGAPVRRHAVVHAIAAEAGARDAWVYAPEGRVRRVRRGASRASRDVSLPALSATGALEGRDGLRRAVGVALGLSCAALFLSWAPFLAQRDVVVRHFDAPNYLVVAKTLYVPTETNPLPGYVLHPKYFAMHTPLFPLVIRACSLGVGYETGLAVATILLALASAAVFALWAREAAPEVSSALATLAFLLLPARMFLYRSLGASEALMTLLVVLAAALAWRRGREDWAFFAAALATVTRTNGVLVVAVLFLLLVARRKVPPGAPRRRARGAFACSRSSRGTGSSSATSFPSSRARRQRARDRPAASRSRSSARWPSANDWETAEMLLALYLFYVLCAARLWARATGSRRPVAGARRPPVASFASAISHGTTSPSRPSRSCSRVGTSGRGRGSRRSSSRCWAAVGLLRVEDDPDEPREPGGVRGAREVSRVLTRSGRVSRRARRSGARPRSARDRRSASRPSRRRARRRRTS